LTFTAELITGTVQSIIFSTQEFEEIQLQCGLLQICKGLEFLHSNQISHLCLCPESIYVDHKGDWKLGGFNFAEKIGSRMDKFIDFPKVALPLLGYFGFYNLTSA
jgi:serine/threonine protein kinase